MNTVKHLTLRTLLDAGVHFGHQIQKWNPKMKPYVFGSRNGIHIIDLQQTLAITRKSCEFIKQLASNGQSILFVGTKNQAIKPIQTAAKKCEQFYVTKRWLGGTMTNFKTIKASIDRLRKLEIMKEKGEFDHFSKKEITRVEKELLKLNEYLSGIREMKDTPSAIFVVDIKKEHIAVAEARKLKIPVVGIADTNIDPYLVDFPIPGNDDSIRSITLFTELITEAYLEGQKQFKAKQQLIETTPQIKKTSDDKPDKSKEKSKADGPIVIRNNKRKLVAAGTADEMEIDLELAQTTKKQKGSTPGKGTKLAQSKAHTKTKDHTKDKAHTKTKDHTKDKAHTKAKDHTKDKAHTKAKDHTKDKAHTKTKDHIKDKAKDKAKDKVTDKKSKNLHQKKVKSTTQKKTNKESNKKTKTNLKKATPSKDKK